MSYHSFIDVIVHPSNINNLLKMNLKREGERGLEDGSTFLV